MRASTLSTLVLSAIFCGGTMACEEPAASQSEPLSGRPTSQNAAENGRPSIQTAEGNRPSASSNTSANGQLPGSAPVLQGTHVVLEPPPPKPNYGPPPPGTYTGSVGKELQLAQIRR